MKKLWLLCIAALLVSAMAGCSNGVSAVSSDISSDIPSDTSSASSQEVSSVNDSSSETPSSEAVSSDTKPTDTSSKTPDAGYVYALEERPKKEPVAASFDAGIIPTYKGMPEKNPVIDLNAESILVSISCSSGYMERGRPIALYRKDKSSWTLLNPKEASAKTEADYIWSSATCDELNTKGLLTKEGEYKLVKQYGDKLYSLPFTVKDIPEPEQLKEGWENGPASTNWKAYLEKSSYPVGTTKIVVIEETGNGVVYGSMWYNIYKYDETAADSWKKIVGTVPNTGGSVSPPNKSYTYEINISAITEAGKYELEFCVGDYTSEIEFIIE